jgi:PAS domain S-box-containing protein
MVLQLPARRPERTPGNTGWSLRRYMAVFIAVLVVVAALAALTVRIMAEHDARQAAQGDAAFAARAAATEIAHELMLLRQSTASLAANPQAAIVLASIDAPCNLTFTGGIAFSTGHLDIVAPDGTVKCSSRPRPTGNVYGAAGWLPMGVISQVVAAPYLDPLTRELSAVVASPVGTGLGTVIAIVTLAPVGVSLAASLGGARQLEFLVTKSDVNQLLARSIEPARWVGASVSGTPFAGSAGPDERVGLDGTARLYAQSAVAGSAWTVFAGADKAAAVAVADELANRSLALVLVGGAIVGVAVFVVYRRVAEPVRRLSLVMRGTTPGKAVNAVGAKGATEVLALAEDFDQLMLSVKSELAERLTSEHSAAISERNYRMLFESHPQPMWLYDVDTLAFLEVNAAAIAQYGYSRDEFMHMAISDIRPIQDVPKFLELQAEPAPSYDRSGPWVHRFKDGSTAQVLITSHTVTFGAHHARFVLAEELTASQKLELEMLQTKARVDSTAELSRAKDEMVSMVSHEMRTPLASIVGFTELLITRELAPKQVTEYLSVILQEGRRLTALINDFLDLRRIEGGHVTMRFAPADIAALVTRAVDLLSESDPTGMAIETRLPDDLPLVRVDNDSVFRVMANLLSNACKYSPHGGSIVVGAKVVGDLVEIYVQDEGLGIPDEALTHVFAKFYRVDSPDRDGIKGTGLGLAICKNIIEAHGGKIGVTSEGAGKGSRFYFTIPIVREQAKTGDVLVVEDDSGFAHLIEAELSARGMTSIWAADGETAMQLMNKKRARAVVLDLVLPGVTGEMFLHQLRLMHGDGIPVVVVTLKDLDVDENLALQKAGVTAVLRKGPGTAATAAMKVASALAPELVAS